MKTANGAKSINIANFESEVLQSKKPVLIDFWASWCGPCRILSPVIDEIADELGEEAKVVKVNVDENPELSQKFRITSIPSLLFFKNGTLKEKQIGVQSKASIKKTIESLAE